MIKRIHIEEPREVIYWSKKFEVSTIQLYKAVLAAGSNKVEKVTSYFFNQ